MSFHIDSNGTLHHDQARGFSLNCPHCLSYSHVTPVSVPNYAELLASRPSQVGLVYHCDACTSPLFLRFTVKLYAANRVELGSSYVELERAPERFGYTHLPDPVERALREALAAYSHQLLGAFAAMCRRTVQATVHELGENGRVQLYNQLNEARALAEIDGETFAVVKRVLFGSDADGWPPIPELDDYQAVALLELLKDLLYQSFVRGGRLQQAMTVRRHFAGTGADKVAPLASGTAGRG
jgi:hypothetical protein